jgi:hypothetical protein
MDIENVAPIDKPVMLECPPGELCSRRYPNHTRGCPNHGKRETCPPKAEIWTPEFLDAHTWVVIWNVFDFGAHIEKMKERHWDWTARKLANCLYWQGTARKQLRERIYRYLEMIGPPLPWVETIPEAHGVNVTATMKEKLGIELEWPPKTVTYQVALLGSRICQKDERA